MASPVPPLLVSVPLAVGAPPDEVNKVVAPAMVAKTVNVTPLLV